MKQIITAFIIATLFISCNSSEKTNTTTENSAETEITEKSTGTESKKELKAITTDADLIATALLSAPEASGADSEVIRYNMKGEFVTLREGTNEFSILADDPNKKGFSAAIIKTSNHSWQEEEP
jgi:hypothetical protein